jgi:hypothetical protein
MAIRRGTLFIGALLVAAIAPLIAKRAGAQQAVEQRFEQLDLRLTELPYDLLRLGLLSSCDPAGARGPRPGGDIAGPSGSPAITTHWPAR